MNDALTSANLTDTRTVAARLCDAGLPDAEAIRKAMLFAAAARSLADALRASDAGLHAFYVPGRVEVLGKHTDYAGGRSLVMAVTRGFALVAAPRSDAAVSVTDVGRNERVDLELGPDLEPPLGQWANYPMTVARRLARNFPDARRGADIAFASDLPPAAGLSSSSAMIVAFALAMVRINDLQTRADYQSNITSNESLAEYLGTVENGQTYGTLAGAKGVGTFGGSEDHTAILCAKPNTLSQYAYCPTRFERHIRLPDGYAFVIASSGVVAEKTGAALDKYNRASLLAGAVAEQWRSATGRDDPHMAAAVQSAPDAVGRIRQVLRDADHPQFTPPELSDRFEQFYAENEQIIPVAGDALAARDIAEFGRQVDRSQELTATQLGNQVEQTVALAKIARELGALAASAFGAGFGGSVWALVPADRVETFTEQWSNRYAQSYPEPAIRAAFFTTHPGPASFEL